MNTNKVIVIIEASFNPNGMNTSEFKEYSLRSNANAEANGAVVLSKFQVTDNLGTGDTPHMILNIEFPSLAMATEAFTNDEYLSILPLREIAFKEVKILQTNTVKI